MFQLIILQLHLIFFFHQDFWFHLILYFLQSIIKRTPNIPYLILIHKLLKNPEIKKLPRLYFSQIYFNPIVHVFLFLNVRP